MNEGAWIRSAAVGHAVAMVGSAHPGDWTGRMLAVERAAVRLERFIATGQTGNPAQQAVVGGVNPPLPAQEGE